MSICTQAGIGRIAATGEWTHPLAIVESLRWLCSQLAPDSSRQPSPR